ncbi:MAG: recombinase family protein [Oscillospiraceae bacterium]|nr:recombinase family protein [Oscillospiraceae bacterium]
MPVAMYLRKSRAEEQESVAETLARHREALTAHAAQNGLAVAGVYEEVVSGDSLFARPAMLALLRALETGLFEAVLCMDIDRLGRGNMKEQGIILETFKQAGVKIITPRKTFDLNNELDETYGEFQAFMARQELKLIKGRMQRGVIKSVRDGCHMGPPPYGYERAWRDRRPTLVPRAAEAAVVRGVFARYLAGQGVQAIADTLSGQGISPPRGTRWRKATIARMLRNEVYLGRVVRKTGAGEAIALQGLHPPLIDGETFRRVAERLGSRAQPPSAGPLRNALAGLLRCRVCGRAMERHGRGVRAYAVCRTKGCVRMCELSRLEAAVWDVLEALWGDRPLPPCEPAGPEDSQKRETLRRSAQIELGRLMAQRDSLHDLLEQGVYTPQMFQERQAALEVRARTARAALAAEEGGGGPDAAPKVPATLGALLDICRGTGAATRNRLLKLFVRQAYYYRGQARGAGFVLELEVFTPACGRDTGPG